MRSAPLLALLLVANAAPAAPPPIDTDGPDYVESSEVVPRGRFQYEVDLTSTAASPPGRAGPTTSTPALLKYGFAENFELRVAPEGYLRQDGRSGAGDTALGVKWHVQDRDARTGAPAVSWILHFEAPTGSRALSGSGVRPSLRSVITWELPHDFALGLMPGVRYDAAADGHRYGAASFGAVLNRRLTDTVRVFVELSASQIAHQRDGGTIADWDLGAARLIGNDAQIGFRAGVAANRNTPSRYVLIEIAQRF